VLVAGVAEELSAATVVSLSGAGVCSLTGTSRSGGGAIGEGETRPESRKTEREPIRLSTLEFARRRSGPESCLIREPFPLLLPDSWRLLRLDASARRPIEELAADKVPSGWTLLDLLRFFDSLILRKSSQPLSPLPPLLAFTSAKSASHPSLFLPSTSNWARASRQRFTLDPLLRSGGAAASDGVASAVGASAVAASYGAEAFSPGVAIDGRRC
jgi:hypothetical protein